MAAPYYQAVVETLRRSPALVRLGFRQEDINWYGKGRDRHDLMVISQLHWTIRRQEGERAGYEGVNVHFESRRPGALQLDCELTPRLQSEAKADQQVIAPLLAIKGQVTGALRTRLVSALQGFGANIDRVCKDPALPRSLKVLGFELGLPQRHGPDELVNRIAPLIETASPMIDEVLSRGQWDDVAARSRSGPAMPGSLASPDGCTTPPISAELLARISSIRGMPERNMEDAVKCLLVELGHREENIHHQIGHIDLQVQDPRWADPDGDRDQTGTRSL
jgi:hypothetical protein